MSKTALVILAEGFEEVEALTPIDMLRRAGVTVTIAGLGGTSITGSHDISVQCDATVQDMIHHPFDCVVVPGGMPGTLNLLESHSVLEIINYSHRDNKLIAAICAAPRVLDRAGALSGKEYTCYPGTEVEISHGTYKNAPIVVSGNVITGRAVSNSIEFSMTIISQLLSQKAVDDLAKKIVL